MEALADFHPHIIHFPIALLITYSFVELFGTIFKSDFASKTAHLLLAIGVFFAFLAALTGNQAMNVFDGWNENTTAVLNNHELFANLTIWYFTAILILRTILVIKKKFNSSLKYIFIILLPIGIYFVYQTGKFGGELMHKYGIGTEIQNEALNPAE
jgi:uncharacterized membrane protein